jgi:Ti-type conjugative transfer relaxase TraA
MAIYHCSSKPVSRTSGRSAVAAAAYRAGDTLTNQRDGLVHDYSAKAGVLHSEILLPAALQAEIEAIASNDLRMADGSVPAVWALDRSQLWNAAEAAERRSDARVAREFEVALPHEMLPDQRLALVREFAQSLADRYSVAVDFAIHAPHREGDQRNHHAHLLLTTREVTLQGLGGKTDLERENGWLLAQGRLSTREQIFELRQSWEEISNLHLARAGLDLRIDHRSHADLGCEIEPTAHVGVAATQAGRRGVVVERVALGTEAQLRNAARIKADPAVLLEIVSAEKAVFSRMDLARALQRTVPGDPALLRGVFAQVMALPELVALPSVAAATGQGGGPATRAQALAADRTAEKFSTREMVALEGVMADSAAAMAVSGSHGVANGHVERARARVDAGMQSGFEAGVAAAHKRGEINLDQLRDRLASSGQIGLSAQQVQGVQHVTAAGQISLLVGYAGAGKSTLLDAARQAWEAQGYRVQGAALAGKAADGLQSASGIASRTLASLEMSWQKGRDLPGAGDILVVDEAGMVGIRQMARLVGIVQARGAKLVLVGDHEQLQAIGAGAPFRALASRLGFAELTEVRRQRDAGDREASVAFASHRTADGLAHYQAQGAIRFAASGVDARAAVAAAWIGDYARAPEATRLVLAHRRADVADLNVIIRAGLQARGLLGAGPGAGEQVIETRDGPRAFVAGDRVLFLENSRDLGVKNGLGGRIEAVASDHLLIRPDGQDRVLRVDPAQYRAFDHGYATTIHKAQGATVDRSFVLASPGMDRHLTYVAMTRHREEVNLFAARDEFAGPAQLYARLGRAGLKENSLDYLQDFAARRGLAEQFGIRAEADLSEPMRASATTLGLAPGDHSALPGQEQPSRLTALGERIFALAHTAADLIRSAFPQARPVDLSWRVEPVPPAHAPSIRQDSALASPAASSPASLSPDLQSTAQLARDFAAEINAKNTTLENRDRAQAIEDFLQKDSQLLKDIEKSVEKYQKQKSIEWER